MSDVNEVSCAQSSVAKLSVEDQAMQWLFEINGGEPDLARWLEFDAWLSEHPDHEDTYCRFEKNLGRLLNMRTARAVIWLTRIQKGSMTERRLHRFKRWLALPANNDVFECMRVAWHNSLPIQQEVSRRSSSRTRAEDLESSHSSPQGSSVEYDYGPGGAVRVRLISQDAAHWYFLSADDPNMQRSKGREFLAWMRRSPENISELFKIAQLDNKLRKLKLSRRSLELQKSNVVEFTTCGSHYELHREIQQLDEDTTKNSARNPRTVAFKLAAFAASLFFGVALAFVAQDYMQSDQTVATGPSQWHHMTLPDGTAVHVDARSKVAINFTDETRIVHVYAGSAVFDVAKDAKRPFIARTHLVDATATGTRFGVSIDPGVTTTVSEGVVRVTGRGRTDGTSVILRAGEELRVSNSSLTSPSFAHVDAERKLQWAKDGMLLLGGMTVSEGVEELNRRNRTQIVVDSQALGAKVIEYASVKVDSPETYAKVVAQEPGVTLRMDKENGVIRLSE